MTKLSRHEQPVVLKDNEGKKISNPNRITVDQHVIPQKHILEWSTDGKMVDVCNVSNGKVKSLAASSSFFCVRRLWDQWVELKMLGSNEKNYQEQLCLFKKQQPFSKQEHILEYYIMLCVRAWVANKERPDYPWIMSELSYEPSQGELEDNELAMDGKCHFVEVSSRESSQQLARQVVKMAMLRTFDQWYAVLKGQQWITFHSKDEQFILPDALHESFLNKLYVMPICPNYVLITDATYKYLIENDYLSVSFINKILIESSINYYVQQSQRHD